jgi:D-alanine transaminase
MPEPLPVCYLNGEYLPLREARISPLDRAFLFGDGVYEVIPVYGGRPFRFHPHFDRLDRSLAALGMAPVRSRAEWEAICRALVERNGGKDLYLYVQVSRGAEYGRSHAPPPGLEPTVFAFATPLPAENLGHGVTAITAQDIRWQRCNIKSTALLANVLLKQQAVEAGAHETILLRDGLLTEGTAATVHVVIAGQILTPPRSPQLLPGTTQDVVTELAAQVGIPTRSAAITEAQLRAADEIFIGAATIGPLAVTRLDGRAVGSGEPGPVWRRIRERFEACKTGLAGKPL